jgi:hypothetical protein
MRPSTRQALADGASRNRRSVAAVSTVASALARSLSRHVFHPPVDFKDRSVRSALGAAAFAVAALAKMKQRQRSG